MAMLLSGLEEFSSCDMNRVIRMCLIHDLGEAFTGDIPTFQKTSEDTEKELSELGGWVSRFPAAQREEFQSLYAEMEALQTPEAKVYKAIDKIEAVIQHNESDIHSWLPLEYDLQRTYGQEEVQFSPWLRDLRELVDEWTEEKNGLKRRLKPDDKLRNILFLDRKYDTMLGDYVSTDMTDTERKSVWQKQLPNRSSGMS